MLNSDTLTTKSQRTRSHDLGFVLLRGLRVFVVSSDHREGVTMRRAAMVAAGLMLLAITGGSAAEVQWPQFRGPGAGAIPDDPTLPDKWSEKENVVWRTPIPGLGWS